MSHKATKIGLTGLVIALAFGGLMYSSLSEGTEYYKHVDEVMANPQQWEGKRLQLHGFVVPKSIGLKTETLKDNPKLAAMTSLLKGPTELMWSTESASAVAKLALKHAKEVEKFQIKGGFFDGQVLDVKGVEHLSKMPGKQELQASLLMTFMAAPTDFVRLMAAAPTNFLYVLAARERSLGG